jgi:hypothetical protein
MLRSSSHEMTQECGSRAIRSTSALGGDGGKPHTRSSAFAIWLHTESRQTFERDGIDFVVNVKTRDIFPVAEQDVDEFVDSNLAPRTTSVFHLSRTRKWRTSSRIMTSQLWISASSLLVSLPFNQGGKDKGHGTVALEDRSNRLLVNLVQRHCRIDRDPPRFL